MSRNLAIRGAALLAEAYEAYKAQYEEITRRAARRFCGAEWHAMQRDSVERLGLYRKVLDKAIAELGAILGEATRDHSVWSLMKDVYSRILRGTTDVELAETFFNSATRRIYHTVGVDPGIEFVSLDPSLDSSGKARFLVVWEYPRGTGSEAMVRQILEDHPFSIGYEDLERDAALAARIIDERLAQICGTPSWDFAEVLRPVFFRNKGAYLVGRIVSSGHIVPLAISLVNPAGAVVVDAVMVEEDDVSIVFSFTRSYFHVDIEVPRELVAFLKSIMPRKPVAELYTAIGQNKHGKTELYRDFLAHMSRTDDRFVFAPGERGMVMLVFTLPSYDVVFKIIRDSFAYPKTTSRKDVMQKYQLVFSHTRAGRLVDVQEFEHLEFDRGRFDEALLEALLREAASTVRLEGDQVIIKHLYTERRVTPLNIYLQEAGEERAREAILDFGEGLKELAANNVFPGDLLLKNFGVTRHGRIVFYDYDELTFVTECNFREMPQAEDDEEYGYSEPSFYVGENDIFPEEFMTFLGLRGELREAFLKEHGDLLTPAFWNGIKKRHKAGEVLDVFPYRPALRLHAQKSGFEGALG
ncbi:MAG: bifunctional isocitrate dehydrogenase kinase/phosphatase [Acidobacteria bacterium]|nr:bifunctional isocitrate dehydrogenase kinase/phosphatase [Acidobacteriota bacterium]MCG3194021.1 Isocitrate dehydrogenase kinase/phosphatase [Thermoanaerobaculia bacterium]MCK6681753.1 bifunctional isocitrate dehydrogenase kinase/phosphatase [Thermoanaerobaculia bacterium]